MAARARGGASIWDRCDAETSPERGFYYSASKHLAGQPIVAGWSYQWISQLDWARRFLDRAGGRRAHPARLRHHEATIDQVCRLVGRLPGDGQVPMFVFDTGYDPGLAPAAHGANRTGRVFTGDRSGGLSLRCAAPGRPRR